MATIITAINQKGGVGKTSFAHHLSGVLADKGRRRILLLDNDPQASLTQGLWGPEAMRSIGPRASIATLYDPEADPVPEALIRPSGLDGISLIPGSVHVTEYNQLRPSEWGASLFVMRSFLREVRDEFDLVIIDCPPNLHLCSWAALTASDAVVVPLQPEDYGAQGIVAIQDAIETVRTSTNPSIRLAGYLLTMYDKRLAIHLAYESRLRSLYGSAVFTHPVPMAKDFKEAVASRLPVSHYKPRSAAAKAAQAVADELLERLAAIREGREPGTDAGMVPGVEPSADGADAERRVA